MDTSALVKIYHAEPGHERMRQLYAGDDRLSISALSVVEFTSATTRKLREGQLDEQAHAAFMDRFNADVNARYTVYPLYASVIRTAARLLLNLTGDPWLRSLDALQIATVLEMDVDQQTLLTADIRMLSVAHSMGLRSEHPVT